MSQTHDELARDEVARRGETRRGFLRRTLVLAGAGAGAGLLAACAPAAQPAPTAAPAPPAAAPAAQPTAAPKPAATTAPAAPAAAAPTQAAPAKVASGPLTKITSAGITTGVSGLIYQSLQTFKMDEKNGFSLETKAMENEQASMAVPLGVTDVGVVTVPEATRLNAEGHAVRLVAPMYWMHVFLMVKGDAPYQDWHELKGKKVQSPGQASGSQNTLQVIAAIDGLDWNKDFNVTFIPALPAAVASLDRGEVDAIQIWPPLGSTLLAQGNQYRKLADVNEEWKKRAGGDLVNGAVGMTQTWYDSHKDLAKAVQTAVADTNKYLNENDAAWEHPDILKVLGSKKEDLPVVRPAIRKVLSNGVWDDASSKAAETMATKIVEVGIVKDKPKDDILLRI